jgi:hypothetical protein
MLYFAMQITASSFKPLSGKKIISCTLLLAMLSLRPDNQGMKIFMENRRETAKAINDDFCA